MKVLKYLTSKKYRFFAKKVRDVQYNIWDLDFKVAKSRQVREGVRQDRDRCIEAVQNIETKIKEAKEGDDIQKLTAERDGIADNARRFEAQMKMIDDQIQGVPAEGTNPGQQGINDTIRSLAELRNMYREHMAQI